MDKKPKIDMMKLTPEQRDKLENYQQTQNQLQTLQDIADISQEMLGIFDEYKENSGKNVEQIGALLTDMRESLSSIKSKKDPEFPDTAKPVVDAVAKLEKALTSAITKIDVKPVVDAPQVSVSTPDVDLKGVEKAVSSLAQAFDKAISKIKIPEAPKTDFKPLLDAWDGISEQLVSIENATRMKPQPGSVTVTNLGDITTQTDALTDTELRASPVSVTSVNSVIDTNNSTTTTLGSGGVYTGTATDVSGYGAVVLQVFSNRASATRGLSIQCSTDGTNWDHAHDYTYVGGSVGYHFEETLCGNYFRIVYTNTNAAQTVFRLQSKLLKGSAGPHLHPIDYDIDVEHPAPVTRAVITGETTAGGGGLVNVKVNPSGTLETNAAISSLPNEGQQTMANSISVAIASNQSAVPISAASLPLPSGASTSANQTTANTSLANIDTNTSKDASTFTFYSASLSTAATITPSAGMSIKIYKVLVTNSSNNATFRNVTLASTSLGTFLQGEAISSSWNITLATDEVLTITPSGGTVYVNIQYKEI